jgi:hypothetical protein
MGRAKLPEARVEPRGVGGHLAQLKAQARESARVAGAAGVVVARVVGWTAFAGGAVALLVWLAPPPRNPQLDNLRNIQADIQRSQANLEQMRRSLETMQRLDHARLIESLGNYKPMPPYDVDQVYLRDPSAYKFPELRNAPQPTWQPPAWEPEPSTYSQPTATKAERADARARAAEAKRADRADKASSR